MHRHKLNHSHHKSAVQHLTVGVALAAALASLPTNSASAAGPAPVDLRSAARFTILAGAAITTTGGGAINGDVGASPIAGSAVGVTDAQVNGTIYCVDSTGPPGSVVDPGLLTTAKGDLTTAYNDAAGRTPTPTGDYLDPGAGNIGGMTLLPGLYKFSGTAFITGSSVTLDGGPDDVWIFQIASDLQVGSGVQVILAGGAKARNIYWQVGTTVNIGTSAAFKGTIMASQSIVMMSTSTLEGRLLAFTAGITFDAIGGTMSAPKAPRFTAISLTDTGTRLISIDTTPYFLLTVQTTTNLANPDWTTLTTATPTTSLWSFTNNVAPSSEQYYRAFLNAY